jgi:hypothetical protein
MIKQASETRLGILASVTFDYPPGRGRGLEP